LPRRVIFAIRSKFGDTLIAYQCARAFADAHPADEVTLLTRTAYANLLAAEPGIRVIGFNSRAGMTLKLLWLRLTAPAFDVLAILWGSGPPIRLIGRLVNAKRKIAWTGRFAPDLFEEGEVPPDPLLVEPAASVVRVFEPGFVLPGALHIPSLAARWRAAPDRRAVGIVPIADEARRNLDAPTLSLMIAEARRRHPDAPVRIFVNPGNAGSEQLLAMALPAGCEMRPFRDLRALLAQYLQLAAWIGTDTGLYHFAVAIGIPATVFFGPTQPHKIVMPAQAGTKVFRLAVLEDRHCDEKGCMRPLCLHGAIATWAGAATATSLDETPPACPLRAFPAARLTELRDASPA
jgi:ADP-heptose:LPS heptosyltransferase